MTNSVESRFVAIISGALLTVVAPLFTLFLILSSHEARTNLRDHMEILLVANSQALGKPLWELDEETINQITGALVSDPAIRIVRVSDTLGQLDIVQTSSSGPEELGNVTRIINYKTPDGLKSVGTITVHYAKIGLLPSLSRIELAFASIFVLAILTVFGASVIGNRLMIIKPLLRLTAAIEATRRLGSRHHVDWRSNDEMGQLARSFNEMQIQLEHEEQAIKRAHQRTTEIYNLTPAMLFSLDENDNITAVSDYWLEATGYARAQVIGRAFSDLVTPEDRNHFISRRTLPSGNPDTTGEVTVRVIRADATLIDVLLMERRLEAADQDKQASWLSVMTDVTELRRSEQRNMQQAVSDHLTGLFNRQGFEAELDAQIRKADADKSELACLFIDLDRFKQINDTLGHAVGDGVLKQFVQRLRPMLGNFDSAARLGGDEFAILLGGENTERRATDFCNQVCDIFSIPFNIDGNSVRLSASIGLALYPTHASSAAELLLKSDMAMYSRKRDGKNGASVFDPVILTRARERAELEHDIELAIAANWFQAYLQPIVGLENGGIVGFEALMRLDHPAKGLMPPAAIIDVAEETGTIGRIGNLILEDSIINLSRISRIPGMQDTYVAVNFSALQFEASLPTRIVSLLNRHNIRPERLVVEITEAVLMNDNPHIRTILNAISKFGCRIALDDFGTGYSSLSYLNRFPVDIVKIDQSFTRAISDPAATVSDKSRMLVEGITAISHKMNCTVIAEGIETHEQQYILEKIGIDCGQGYLFARPTGIEDLIVTLREQTRDTQKLLTH